MIFGVCDNKNIDEFTCIKHQTLAAFEQGVQAASKTERMMANKMRDITKQAKKVKKERTPKFGEPLRGEVAASESTKGNKTKRQRLGLDKASPGAEHRPAPLHRLQPFPNLCRSSFASRRRWLPWTRVQLQPASAPLPSRRCFLTKGLNFRTTQNLCFEIGCV